MTPPVLELPRESSDWAAVTVTTTAGAAVNSAAVRFAVLPKGTRPADADWTLPIDDPDGSSAYGVNLPAAAPDEYGVWTQIQTTGGRSVVFDPDSVGYVIRT